MQTVRVHDSFGTISENDLSAFEERWSINLPRDYRQFLLRSNGGHTGFDAGFRGWNIGYFFGLNTGENWCDLDWNRNIFQGRMPAELLGFANTSIGDQICLQVLGDDTGRVFVWSDEPTGIGSEDSPDFLCDSFSTFFAGIELDPDDGLLRVETLPVFQGAATGDLKRLRAYLDAGKDPNARNVHREPLLVTATRNFQPEAVELLLEAGADLEARDADGCTALFVACRQSYVDGVRLLLERGAAPNAIGWKGQSPLVRAVSGTNTRIVRLLVAAGADVNYEMPNGFTALQFCNDNEYMTREIRSILLNAKPGKS